MKVELFTRFSCEEDSARSSVATGSELTDHDAWTGEYIPKGPRIRGHRRKHYGSVPVTVLPVHRESRGPVRSYTDPEAEGIILSVDAVHTSPFPSVNSTWQTEFADKEMTRNKWNPIWDRMHRCEGDRYCPQGGAHLTASDAWAKKSCPQYWADRREANENVSLPETAPEGQQAFSA